MARIRKKTVRCYFVTEITEKNCLYEWYVSVSAFRTFMDSQKSNLSTILVDSMCDVIFKVNPHFRWASALAVENDSNVDDIIDL